MQQEKPAVTDGMYRENWCSLADFTTEKVVVENNSLSDGWSSLLPAGTADYAQAQASRGVSMIKNGATADEISAALAKAAEGDMPEGQDAAKGLITAWGNFFGMPLDLIMSNEKMTPEKAAEIISGGVPTSEAKLLQYVAAKAFFAITKSTTIKAETGNSLIYHENFGGHVIEKHVNKSDAELLARLQAEPRLGATSTFFDSAAADRAIGNAFADKSNQRKLTEWLVGDQTRLVLTHEEMFNVGRVINKGDGSSHLSNKIILVVDKDPLMPKGYRVHTAYPK